VSQQYKQLEDRISRLESDLAQLRQVVAAAKAPPAVAPVEPEPKRGPGRPKKAE
jgi:outer membrane murein-binding lipoprotein Lpp